MPRFCLHQHRPVHSGATVSGRPYKVESMTDATAAALPIALVISDIDGTLITSNHEIAEAACAAEVRHFTADGRYGPPRHHGSARRRGT